MHTALHTIVVFFIKYRVYTAPYACYNMAYVLQPEKYIFALARNVYTCDFATVAIRFQNITVTTRALKWAPSVVTVVWTEVWTVHTLIHINTHHTIIYRLVAHSAPTAL